MIIAQILKKRAWRIFTIAIQNIFLPISKGTACNSFVIVGLVFSEFYTFSTFHFPSSVRRTYPPTIVWYHKCAEWLFSSIPNHILTHWNLFYSDLQCFYFPVKDCFDQLFSHLNLHIVPPIHQQHLFQEDLFHVVEVIPVLLYILIFFFFGDNFLSIINTIMDCRLIGN